MFNIKVEYIRNNLYIGFRILTIQQEFIKLEILDKIFINFLDQLKRI